MGGGTTSGLLALAVSSFSFFLSDPALSALPFDQRLPDEVRGPRDGPGVADVHLDGCEARRAELGDERAGVGELPHAAEHEEAAAGELERRGGADA